MSKEEFDIYGDLEDFDLGERIKSLEHEVNQLKEKNDENVKKISALEVENAELLKSKNLLLNNISSAIKTAKSELARKDKVIAELRKENESILCNNKYKGNRQEDRNKHNLVVNYPIKTEESLEKRSNSIIELTNSSNVKRKCQDNSNVSSKKLKISNHGFEENLSQDIKKQDNINEISNRYKYANEMNFEISKRKSNNSTSKSNKIIRKSNGKSEDIIAKESSSRRSETKDKYYSEKTTFNSRNEKKYSDRKSEKERLNNNIDKHSLKLHSIEKVDENITYDAKLNKHTNKNKVNPNDCEKSDKLNEEANLNKPFKIDAKSDGKKIHEETKISNKQNLKDPVYPGSQCSTTSTSEHSASYQLIDNQLIAKCFVILNDSKCFKKHCTLDKNINKTGSICEKEFLKQTDPEIIQNEADRVDSDQNKLICNSDNSKNESIVLKNENILKDNQLSDITENHTNNKCIEINNIDSIVSSKCVLKKNSEPMTTEDLLVQLETTSHDLSVEIVQDRKQIIKPESGILLPSSKSDLEQLRSTSYDVSAEIVQDKKQIIKPESAILLSSKSDSLLGDLLGEIVEDKKQIITPESAILLTNRAESLLAQLETTSNELSIEIAGDKKQINKPESAILFSGTSKCMQKHNKDIHHSSHGEKIVQSNSINNELNTSYTMNSNATKYTCEIDNRNCYNIKLNRKKKHKPK